MTRAGDDKLLFLFKGPKRASTDEENCCRRLNVVDH